MSSPTPSPSPPGPRAPTQGRVATFRGFVVDPRGSKSLRTECRGNVGRRLRRLWVPERLVFLSRAGPLCHCGPNQDLQPPTSLSLNNIPYPTVPTLQIPFRRATCSRPQSRCWNSSIVEGLEYRRLLLPNNERECNIQPPTSRRGHWRVRS